MPAIDRSSHEASSSSLPVRKHKFDTPKLRLHLNDLGHEGSSIFLSNVKGSEDFEIQVQNVLNLLYTPRSPRPGTRSVTLILRRSGGVAYTTGTDLDDDHKEIHFDLDYIRQAGGGGDAAASDNTRHELLGVLCHELVHCFQWNAEGSAPGGLIEGIADYVRLKAGLSARHWRRDADGDDWDAGYQKTGYFLDYLEQRFGEGTVRAINAGMRVGKYDEAKLFGDCCDGGKVSELWKEYREHLKHDQDRSQSQSS